MILIALLGGRLEEAVQLCETYIERFNQLLAGQEFSQQLAGDPRAQFGIASTSGDGPGRHPGVATGLGMRNSRPVFDPATRYRIELQGPVDVHWLQSFEASTQISVAQAGQTETITVLTMQADQSGIVGLFRRLHSLGMTILQITVVSDAGHGRL